MPSTPTLLRQTPPAAPTATQILAGQIRAHCGRQRITQRDLAAGTGLSRSKVSRIWHGKRIYLDELTLIVLVLDVPFVALLADSGGPHERSLVEEAIQPRSLQPTSHLIPSDEFIG